MNLKSPGATGVAFLLCLSLSLPTELASAPQTAGQRAGEISRVIPAVNIGRGGKTISASAKSVVDWQDQINTLANARARVGLDDGSVLNVGSDSSMRVVKHDAAAQQTELELTYGKLRTQAQKISKPDGKFEVRTPAGVAGVVGTDFYVAFDNNVMNVIVFDGLVRVCNLAGACVVVKPGQTTNVRSNDNSAPPPPAQATLSMLTSVSTDTDSGGGPGLSAPIGHPMGAGTALAIGVLAAIPAVVIPVVSSHNNGGKTAVVPPCQANPVAGNCHPG
jgi:FecR-like protein